MLLPSFLALIFPLLASACYSTHGTIQQLSNTCTGETIYLPSLYLSASGTQICDGHYSGEEANAFNSAFIPGGIPTNSTHGGPWVGYDCSTHLTNVQVSGINGQALIADNETAVWVLPGDLAWAQVATAEGLAGIPCLKASVWTFDSGDVGYVLEISDSEDGIRVLEGGGEGGGVGY
ncbi:hypothetical protein B7494_g1092 [Chlorociboria aeruginascens]|nr:hypothetical protein B7494_g1092 [Chlorociboria aeruginascens]